MCCSSFLIQAIVLFSFRLLLQIGFLTSGMFHLSFLVFLYILGGQLCSILCSATSPWQCCASGSRKCLCSLA